MFWELLNKAGKKDGLLPIGTVSIPFPTFNNCYVTFGALVGTLGTTLWEVEDTNSKLVVF